MDSFEDFDFSFEDQENLENRQQGKNLKLYKNDPPKKLHLCSIFENKYTSIKKCPKKRLHFLAGNMDYQFFPLGSFQFLPDEMFNEIFNMCNLEELGNLCLAHKELGKKILNYLFFSKNGLKNLLKDSYDFNGTEEEFATTDEIMQLFSSIGKYLFVCFILFADF